MAPIREETRISRKVLPVTAATLIAMMASVALDTGAQAATTATAQLDCGSATYTVDGFGRGQVLHVTGSNRNFVVTRAVRADGTVLFDSPASADRPIVTCTTVTPAPNNTTFTLSGFFTPVA